MFRVYRALANTVGTTWELGEGFLVAQSRLSHPLVNFAFAHQLNAYSARELADLVASATLNVYVDDEDPVVQELMRRNGFGESFSMHCLNFSPATTSAPEPGLNRDLAALNISFCAPDDRRAAAQFMLHQFFRHQDRGTQAIFGRALELATELPIATATLRGNLIAAGLLTPEAKNEPSGIFNFCVDGRSQKQGVGSHFLRWLTMSRPSCEFAVQCSDHIADWYQKRGFTKRGSVVAYRKIVE